MGATTDSEMIVKYDVQNKPGISNLIILYKELSGMNIEEIEEKFKDSNYGEFKREVADLVVETLIPIQQKYNELLNSIELDEILDKGREKTLEISKKKYFELKELVGLKR